MRYSEFLKENYDMLLGIFNRMKIGIWITDEKGVVLMVNDESVKTGGLKREDLIGESMSDLIKIGYITESSALNALESGKEEAIIEEMGEGGHCLATSLPLEKDGKLDLIICVERDISEIVNLRNALQNQKDITAKIREQLLQANIDTETDDDEIVANSFKMIRVKETAQRIGSLNATTIILGESGTGKERIADLVYKSSQRVDRPFIKVNCAAIPESLIESELFGYEGGAFTGAKSSGQKGMFEEADGGTIFLDEIGELPMSMQSKLLRVLENGEIRRVGASASISVDVRIIAATNRNLKKEVEKGRFRDDLYYRLMVLPIFIPSLKERKEDLLPLVNLFLRQFNNKYHLKKSFSDSAVREIEEYSWPGNVRELRNMVERLVVSGEGEEISGFQVRMCLIGAQDGESDVVDIFSSDVSLEKMMFNYEKRIIVEAVERYGSMSEAARRLGINKSTISRKLKMYKEEAKERRYSF